MSIPDIAQTYLDRASRSRRGTSILDTLDPKTTAHVAIDLQGGFLREGALLEVPAARRIVPAINRISQALRTAGGRVIFTRYAFNAQEAAPWRSFYQRVLNDPFAARHQQVFTPGSADYDLWPDLDVTASDLVLDKTRFSAFTPGTCDLPGILEQNGIRTLIITGTLTNVCCESTARDAMQYGYDVIFVSDGTATLTEAEQAATLTNMHLVFGHVVTSSALCEALDKATSRVA